MKVKVLVTQLCLTLCDPMDCSLPGCSVHGFLWARILECVAILFLGDLPNPGAESRSPELAGAWDAKMAKMASEEALQIAKKRREAKSKGESSKVPKNSKKR